MKNLLVLLGSLLLSLGVFYYAASPYQSCMREGSLTAEGCARFTSW